MIESESWLEHAISDGGTGWFVLMEHVHLFRDGLAELEETRLIRVRVELQTLHITLPHQTFATEKEQTHFFGGEK